MRRHSWYDKTVEFHRAAPGHQVATLYGPGVGIELQHRRRPLRLNIERALDGPGWVVTPAYSVGGVEQPTEVAKASAAFIEHELIYGPHPTLAAAKAAIKEAWTATYSRAAVPRLRARAETLRAEASDLDQRADRYVADYGEAS